MSIMLHDRPAPFDKLRVRMYLIGHLPVPREVYLTLGVVEGCRIDVQPNL